jgi:hypothetical protein
MMATSTMGSSIIRFVLAMLMVFAMIGPVPVAAGGDWVTDGAHRAQAASSHDCCAPEPTMPDERCGMNCAQATCGWAALPAIAGWPAPMERLSVQWVIAPVLADNANPETATPPPRA